LTCLECKGFNEDKGYLEPIGDAKKEPSKKGLHPKTQGSKSLSKFIKLKNKK
jgi:hypothetical protein